MTGYFTLYEDTITSNPLLDFIEYGKRYKFKNYRDGDCIFTYNITLEIRENRILQFTYDWDRSIWETRIHIIDGEEVEFLPFPKYEIEFTEDIRDKKLDFLLK